MHAVLDSSKPIIYTSFGSERHTNVFVTSICCTRMSPSWKVPPPRICAVSVETQTECRSGTVEATLALLQYWEIERAENSSRQLLNTH